MAKYIKREDAIQFCGKVLGTDTVYSVEVKMRSRHTRRIWKALRPLKLARA